MAEHISPYELLCASKPRKTPSFVTPYDLYSRAQQSEPPASAQAQETPSMRAAPAAPAARTHYITDIHARHKKASRQTPVMRPPAD